MTGSTFAGPVVGLPGPAFVVRETTGRRWAVEVTVSRTENSGRTVWYRAPGEGPRWTDYTSVYPAAACSFDGGRITVRPYRWTGSAEYGGATSVDTIRFDCESPDGGK